MAGVVDLTTVGELKDFINPDLSKTTASDMILSRIITAVSSGISRYVSRPLDAALRAERRNGNGTGQIRTLVYPIISVTSVVIQPCGGSQGTTITPNTNGSTPSLTFDKWFISLLSGYFGNTFPYGAQNVTLNYLAGYNTPGMVAIQTLPPWPGNSAVVKARTQIQVNGYVFICRIPGTTQASGMPAFPTPAGGVSPTLPGYVWPSPPLTPTDGHMTIFVLASAPNPAQATQVYLGGLLQAYGEDFTVSGNILTMFVPPANNSVLLAAYPTAGVDGVAPTVGPILNTVVVDGSVVWSCEGFVPVILAGVPWIPDDFQQACLQQSALLFKNRTRVGDTGSGVGPDRINYFLKDAHPSTLAMLNPHKEVFPTDGMGPV